jgi:hypothetical protein
MLVRSLRKFPRTAVIRCKYPIRRQKGVYTLDARCDGGKCLSKRYRNNDAGLKVKAVTHVVELLNFVQDCIRMHRGYAAFLRTSRRENFR